MWKEFFSTDPLPRTEYWIGELHRKYPCASYGGKVESEATEIEWLGLVPVMERYCPLCDREFDREDYRRLIEVYGPPEPGYATYYTEQFGHPNDPDNGI